MKLKKNSKVKIKNQKLKISQTTLTLSEKGSHAFLCFQCFLKIRVQWQ